MNILKEWIVLKAHSEWLLRLQVSFAIQLQATLAKFVLRNVVIIMAVNEIKSFFSAMLSHCFSTY